MFKESYSELGPEERLLLSDISVNPILQKLIDMQISRVKEDIVNLEISNNLTTYFTIAQQRLSALQELQEFLNQLFEEHYKKYQEEAATANKKETPDVP